MKNKKVIIATAAIGAILLLGIGLVLKGQIEDQNTPEIIKEGKALSKGTDSKTYVNNAFEMFKKHASISNEVWDGYDLSNKIIIVGEKDSDTDNVIKAWKLTNTDKKELTGDEINKVKFPSVGGYDKIDFEDKEGIVISINEDILGVLSFLDFNYIYVVAVHEMYHFYGDDIAKYDELNPDSQDSTDRYTKFPKESTPRVYRKMVYDNLVSAYENPSEQNLYLGKAKYWNEKWKNDYPKEYNQAKVLDIAEGKARYVEYLMCIDYKGISTEEKIKAIKSFFNKELDILESIDSESYELGFVSGILLDNINPKWKNEITENPQVPVEMLLKDVKVIKDDSNRFDKVSKKANYIIDKGNKELKKHMKNIEQAKEDKNIPLLQLSSKLMEGSFTVSDFIACDGDIVVVNFGAVFKNNDGKAKIENTSAYLLTGENDSYNVPITMEYKIENNRLVIEEKGVSVDIKIKEAKDSDGRTVYIME
ncbi:MAG: hypothetical protein RR942_12785 [Romboutsia sp.]